MTTRLIEFIIKEASLPPKAQFLWYFPFVDGLDIVAPICLHNKHWQLTCRLVEDNGEIHLLCCFQSGAVSMVLCASLPLFPCCYTVGLSISPLWAPVPSKALLLSIVLVFSVLFESFPYQIHRARYFSIYKHLKYPSL